MMHFSVDPSGKEPIYKQLIKQVEKALHEGSLCAGELLPSMNELAAKLNISKETVKKSYGLLVDKGTIVPKQGKGFYAADLSGNEHPDVLVIFDKFSIYKQVLYNSFAATLGEHASLTIVNHNQSLDLLQYYLDNYLDNYDYYVVTPHFPLDGESQARAVKLLSRIPNRKLILLDRLQPNFPGNYGAVCQDFENDIYFGLMEGVSLVCRTRVLRVITLSSSLYGAEIRKGVERFTREQQLPVEFLSSAPEEIEPGDTFLILNSQLDAGLVSLARNIHAKGLEIGKDVFVISYNEYETYELVLGGLTTVSADFAEMGRLAAGQILNRRMEKVHCPFHMHRRSTF